MLQSLTIEQGDTPIKHACCLRLFQVLQSELGWLFCALFCVHFRRRFGRLVAVNT